MNLESESVPPKILLFTTLGCHLCEQAAALVRSVGCYPELVEIVDDDQLFERYGLRIPVLALSPPSKPGEADESDKELEWPFDETQLRRWLFSTQP